MHKKCYYPAIFERRQDSSLHSENRELYRKRIDPAEVDTDGRTLLHLASLYGGGAAVVTRGIAAGCDVHASDNRGRTPLHAAAQAGDVGAMLTLISSSARVDDFDGDGYSPLMLAARHARLQAVVALLNRGDADASKSNIRQETPLHLAVNGGSIACVDALIAARAKINYKDLHNNTALILASKSANDSLTERLLRARANPNIRDSVGRTALHWAADINSEQCVRALLASDKTDMEITDQAGDTPFGVALKQGNTVALGLLVDAGCDRGAVDGLNGTALCLATLRGWADIVRVLLDAGEEPDEPGFVGLTALIAAASEGRVDIAKLLLERGADPDLPGRCGFTPLTVTLRVVCPDNAVSRHEMVALLIRANADVNRMSSRPGKNVCLMNRSGPMSFALATGYTSLVHMMLIAGSKVNAADAHAMKTKSSRHFETDDIMAPVFAWASWPVSLQHACRLAVRTALGRRKVQARIDQLPVAPSIRNYLLYPELDGIQCEKASVVSERSPAEVVAALTIGSCTLRVLEGTYIRGALTSDNAATEIS